MGLTAELGEFAATLTFDSLPAAAVEGASTSFADTVGCLLAGWHEPAPACLRRALHQDGEVPGLADRIALWGTAAHALDYDDSHSALGGHPGTVLVPAILALGVAASGRDMLAAYLAGAEVWADLKRREPGEFYQKGWHPTAVFGPLGAAAACASLLRLDAGTTTHALAIAASHSAGIVANFGTMTKPYHAGAAARAGYVAARLAAAGMTAAADAIEHPRGLLTALSPSGAPDRTSPADIPAAWRFTKPGLNVKKYPVCYSCHRALDAILALLVREDVQPSEVAAIRAHISRRAATVLRYSRPRTAAEARFSIEFAMACAALVRRVGLGELTDRFVAEGPVQEMIGIVTVAIDEDNSAPHFVVLTLRDGRVLQSEGIVQPRGAAESPLAPDELQRKFADCARTGGFAEGAEALFATLIGLRDVETFTGLPDALKSPGP